jgi:hypothetical protein
MMSAASKINHRIVGNSVKKFALSSRLGNNVLKAHIRRPMVCMRFPLLTNCRASGDVEKIKSSVAVMEKTMMELKYGLKATTTKIDSMTEILAKHTKFMIELKDTMIEFKSDMKTDMKTTTSRIDTLESNSSSMTKT